MNSASGVGPKCGFDLLKPVSNREDANGRWTVVVQAYSHADLTYKSDKLNAISGIVQLLKKIWQDEYCVRL